MDRHSMLVRELLHIGEALLAAGAEVSRVEDTVERLARAYGAKHVDIFVITSDIVLTICFEDDSVLTQTRRISYAAGTDFSRLEALNALSRACCAQPIPLDELHRRVQAIRAQQRPAAMHYLGSVLGGSMFTMFFGGGWQDGLFAAVVSALVCFLQRRALPHFRNAAVFDLLAGLLLGSIICLASQLFPVLSQGKLLIGVIMLLIPGVALTNSVRDMLVGHTVSGMMRLSESLVLAGALAMGFGSAIYLFGV